MYVHSLIIGVAFSFPIQNEDVIGAMRVRKSEYTKELSSHLVPCSLFWVELL